MQEIELGDFVRRRVRTFSPDARVTVARTAYVSTDPRRLERIPRQSAGQRGPSTAGGPSTSPSRDACCASATHGPGFPENLLREGPSRFRTGSEDQRGQGRTAWA
ncbi:hypothetical protein GCM10020221_01660 [Streptomyces thioluteus]|uniref:Uncharacterized protein n=1 Tax=Streptomyces thioluteus TaxID=66431 RepID=A0ABN3WDL3_STRTU